MKTTAAPKFTLGDADLAAWDAAELLQLVGKSRQRGFDVVVI